VAPSDKKGLLKMFVAMYETSLQTLLDRAPITSGSTTAATSQKSLRDSILDESIDELTKDDLFVIDDPFSMLDLDLKFGETSAEYSLKIPDEQVLRPFFFMRLIQKSVAEGAFLSSTLFVPKFVWH